MPVLRALGYKCAADKSNKVISMQYNSLVHRVVRLHGIDRMCLCPVDDLLGVIQ